MSERDPLVMLLAAVSAIAVMSLLCAIVARFYEPRLTFLQHWLVALKVWALMAFLLLAWDFAQVQLGLPRILNSFVVIGLSVSGAFLTTRLARSSYAIEPDKWLGVGGKVFFSVVPLTLFLLAMYTIIWDAE